MGQFLEVSSRSLRPVLSAAAIFQRLQEMSVIPADPGARIESHSHRSGNSLTVRLCDDLDIDVREPLRRALAPLSNATEAVIDVTDVTYADTTLLTAVIRLVGQRRAHGHNIPLHLVGMSASIRRLFEVTHVDRLVDFTAPLQSLA
jgi:anti-anti-sigma factor